MTVPPSEIIQVARSREKYDNSEDATIDLNAEEANELLERIEGDKFATDHSDNESGKYFRQPSFKRKAVIVAIASLIVLVLVASYLDVVFRGGTIARGVSVSGVEIGGKSISQAKEILNESANKSLEDPIVFILGNDKLSVSPQDIELRYNIDKTLDRAKQVGDSYNPISTTTSFFQRYFGGKDIAPSVTYNKQKFEEVALNIENTFSKGRADAGISIEGLEVKVLPAKNGNGVSQRQAQEALNLAIRDFNRESYTLKNEKVQAQISLDEANRTAEIIRTMISKETKLTTPSGNSLTIAPTQLAQAIVLTPVKKNLEISIDAEKMRSSLVEQLKNVEVAPVDASFSVGGSGVSVVPSVPGKQVDFNSGIKSWIAGKHDFPIGVIDVQPKRDTTWAKNLNITELVSTFTTNFPAGQPRVKNIARAAEVTNNTIVEPGEIFSLNAKLGKRTAESGYVKAPVFSDKDGFFEDFGGGASQFSTTLFNAAFIGGYQDISHTPHTIYISRYPMGREATLNWGSIDMAFKNDSSSGILIRTSVGATSVTVSLYGNKEGRKVTLEGPVIVSQTAIETQYTDDPNLAIGVEKEISKGYPGIVVDNFRTVDKPGKPGRRERYRWTYNMVPRKAVRGTGANTTAAPPA